MRHFAYILSISILSAALFSCSSSKELYQDANVDFSKYKTFGFSEMHIDNQTALEPQKENLEKLMNAIDRELKSRGLKRDKDNHELRVNIGISMEEVATTRETSIRDAPAYMGQRNYHWEAEEIVVSVEDIGTVVLDVIDVKSNRMVWQAKASKVINQKNREKMGSRIDAGVKELFKKFPI